MIPVIVESPYGSPDPEIRERNVAYARAALRDCILRGESPYASHLLYTQPGILVDEVPEERQLGIDAGFVWRSLAKKTVVYQDLGISKGMEYGIKHAQSIGHEIEYRSLPNFVAPVDDKRRLCTKCRRISFHFERCQYLDCGHTPTEILKES